MTYDVAIIGAGIAGASLGWVLRHRSDLRVVLIEMETAPGYHTTGRSAAFWVESYGGPGIVPLTRGSKRFFDAPPPGFCERALLARRASLVIESPDEPGALAREAAVFDASGTVYRWLDAGEMAANPAAPMVRAAWRQRGIEEPDCFDIDVAALHQGYLRSAEIVTDAVVTGLSRQDGLWAIATKAGPIEAKLLVNAAGAWADDVAAMAGAARRGLMPLRRTMAVLETQPPPPADMPVVMDAAGKFYFKPDGGRLWLSPHDESPDVAHDVRPDEIDLAVVIDRFEQVSPARVVRLVSSWAGLR
ncbi:MAG: FAD-binding oxidoreductase, partial [Sandarakinorhabdus sp.]|nr:FAD-binding oxidoreductase [Sandarakinorhabdus sp.]